MVEGRVNRLKNEQVKHRAAGLIRRCALDSIATTAGDDSIHPSGARSEGATSGPAYFRGSLGGSQIFS